VEENNFRAYAEALSTTHAAGASHSRAPTHKKLLDKAANPSATILSQAQRDKRDAPGALLRSSLFACWTMAGRFFFVLPASSILESPDTKLDPGEVINDMKTGKLSLLDWCFPMLAEWNERLAACSYPQHRRRV